MLTSQQMADTMMAGMAAYRTGVPRDYSSDPEWGWGWDEAQRLARPTAAQSVDAITSSDAFKDAAQQFWSRAPKAKTEDRRLRVLRRLLRADKGCPLFSETELADTSVAGHQHILHELERIFSLIENMRVTRDWRYSAPERQTILGAINTETALLELAELTEGA
jgi:hypothetical protein